MKQPYTDPRSTVRQRLDVEKHECWFNHVDSGIGMASENKFIGNKKQGSNQEGKKKEAGKEGGKEVRKEGGKEAGLERNRTGSGTCSFFKGDACCSKGGWVACC